MEKYSDYIIIHAANPNELSEEVKQYLKEGWIVMAILSRMPAKEARKCARHC
ncbi:MAG: hypothetical protein ACXVBJ_15090 [Flavisolibacter sp.]